MENVVSEQLNVNVRVRKASTKYNDEMVSEENISKALKGYQKYHTTKKKKPPTDQFTDLNQTLGDAPVIDGRRKKKVPGEGGKKTKALVIKAIPLTPREKALDEAEERLIALTQARSARAQNMYKSLPVGADEVIDLTSAVKKGVKESSCLLLDWTTREAKMVGSLCKVYWDGDKTWFYARILNYDSHYKRHFVSTISSVFSSLIEGMQ
jgi:non-homologous end joining protein Ku